MMILPGVFPLISSVLILNSFSFVEDLSFELFAQFFFCVLPHHSIGHFYVHTKFVESDEFSSLFDRVLFIFPVSECKKRHTTYNAKKTRCVHYMLSHEFESTQVIFECWIFRIRNFHFFHLFVGFLFHTFW